MPGCLTCAMFERAPERAAVTRQAYFRKLARRAYLASLAICAVRRETLRLALFL